MRDFYSKYQGYLPAAFFVGGFLLDLLTTDRIDQTFSLLQQLAYLLLIMLFFYWEVHTPKAFQQEGRFLNKLWIFHIEALHFLFGSLLSLYTIFYFKSASLVSSFAFMSVLAALMVINELPQFQQRGVMVRSTLLGLCLSSYLIYLVPVMTGQIGVFSFVLAMVLSSAVFLLLTQIIGKKADDPNWVRNNILIPGTLVQLIFVALYFFKLLPPVPISLKHIGIYHSIEKSGNTYALNYERDWWRFYQSGAQSFIKRDGDKVYVFVSVFSPTEFKEKIDLVWFKKSKKGWVEQDTIGLPIRGGRSLGYRGYAYKSNYDLGVWQVRALTSDKRELGRISFEVIEPDLGSTRQWRQDLY